MAFKMTNILNGELSRTKIHKELLGFNIANLNCRGQIISNFKRSIFTVRAIKPRHIFIGVASVTIAAGAAISVGLAGLAVSGAHSAVFSSQGNNESHRSNISLSTVNTSVIINRILWTYYFLPDHDFCWIT